mgnify:FL=1
MTKSEKNNWLINLEDVSSQVDAETVKFVCGKYGVNNIYELSPYNYQDVWNELFDYAREANN